MIPRWRHQTASIHEELQSPRMMNRTGGSQILLEFLNFDIGTVALFWNGLFIDPSISKVGDDFVGDASLRKESALNIFLTRESAKVDLNKKMESVVVCTSFSEYCFSPQYWFQSWGSLVPIFHGCSMFTESEPRWLTLYLQSYLVKVDITDSVHCVMKGVVR